MLPSVQSVTVVGRAWKTIRCQYCCKPYFYINEQKGYGEGFTPPIIRLAAITNEITEKAERKLYEALDSIDSLARCPTCGKFQTPMILDATKQREARARSIGLTTSVLLMFAVAISAAIFQKYTDYLLLATPSVFFLAVCATYVWMRLIRRYFDPNNGVFMWMPPDEELASSGLTVEEFEELCKQEVPDSD